MITKDAALIFYLLTNQLYKSKAFETIECSKKTNSYSGAGFDPILDCQDWKNNSDCNQSSFL